MSQYINAAPQAVLLGVDDLSGRTVPYELRSLPIHLPYIPFYAAWGPEYPMLCTGTTANYTYGAESFDPRGRFVQHSWPLLDQMVKRTNTFLAHRYVPEDAAPPATLAYALDVLETDVQVYERNSDGSFKYDDAGNKIPTGEKVPGYQFKWVIGPCENGALGKGKRIPGSLTDPNTNKQSTIFPIFDWQTSFRGSQGNNRGIRFWAPTIESDNPVNSRVVEDQLAQLYRIQLVQRDSAASSPRVVKTLDGAEYVDVALREDVIDSEVGVEYGIRDNFLNEYRDDNTAGGNPRKWGPFDKLYVYESNLEDVLEMLYNAELLVNDGLAKGPGGQHLINICDGIHFTGIPYIAIEPIGPLEGGTLLTQTATFFADGGTDGTMSKALFDEAVGNWCLEFGDGEMMDDAKYPLSIIYDTGYNVATKFKLMSPQAARKDILTVLSTQDVALPQNDMRQESAMAVTLATQARMHPESEYYGTPNCRTSIVGHSGYLINSRYRKLVPMTIDLADKLALFAGKSTGMMDAEQMPDVNPNNIVTLLRDVNVTFRPARVRNKDWANGLIWVQSFDQDDALFYPGLQSAYPDDTSVANSLLTTMIFAECEKVCNRVWRELTGRSDLTNNQFIQRSNEKIAEKTKDRFANRVVIVPETYYTAQDKARGFSWAAKIKVYANNMKTVGTFTIEAHRREELEE